MSKYVKYKDYYIRPDTYDKAIIGELIRSYSWLKLNNKVVLDVGACFGAFSLFAANSGASHVIAVEPDKGNFALLKKNMRNHMDITTLFNAAVTSCDCGKIDLYKTNGINHGNYSTTEFRGRTAVKVDTVVFKKLLSGFKPSVIKMDCEGCEWDVLLGIDLPKYVKEIAMEIHFTKREWRKLLPVMKKQFKEWEPVLKPKDTGSNWHTLAGWRRR